VVSSLLELDPRKSLKPALPSEAYESNRRWQPGAAIAPVRRDLPVSWSPIMDFAGPASDGGRRLGFLGRGCFRAETKDYRYWIVLDFLGFSCPDLDLSIGYGGITEQRISHSLFP
jgi:hypothetical protein